MLQRNLTPMEQAIMFFQTRGLDVVHSGKEYMDDVTKMVVMESSISLTKYRKQLDKLVKEMEQLENVETKRRLTEGMGLGILRYLIELIVNDQFPSHYWKKLMSKYSKYEMRVVKAQIISHLKSEETNNYVNHLLSLNDECRCVGCLADKLKEIYDVLMEGNKLTFQEGMSYQLNTIGKVKSQVIKDVSQIVTDCLLSTNENNIDYNKYGYSLNISNQPFNPIYIKDNNSDFQTYVRHIKTSEVETFVTQSIVEICNKRGEKKEPLYVVYDEKTLPDGRKQQVTEAVGRGMDLEMYRQIREGQSESYSLDNVLIKCQIDELVCGKFYSEVKEMVEGYRMLPRDATPIFTQDFQIFNICIKVNMRRRTKNSNEMSLQFVSSSGKEEECLFYLNARSTEQRMNVFKPKFKEFLYSIVEDSKRAFKEGGIISLPIVKENVTELKEPEKVYIPTFKDLANVNANLNKDTKVKENVEVNGVHLKSSFDPIKEETTKLFIERVVNNLERMLSGDMTMKDGMYTTIGNGDTSIIYSFKKDGQIKFEMVNRGKVIFQASFEPNMINAKPILDVALTTQLKYTRVQFENDFNKMKMESEMRPNVSGAKELFKGFADSILNELKKGEVQMNETLDTVATQRKAQNEMIDGKKQKAIADLIIKIMDKKMYLDSVKSGTVKETSTEFKFGDLELKINMESVDTDHLVVTFRDGNGNLISSGGIRGDYDSIHSFVMKLITESIKPLILDVSAGAIMKDLISVNLRPRFTLLGDRMFGRDKKKGTFEGFLRDAIESYLNGKKDLPVVNVGIFDGECYSVNINKVTGDTSTVTLYSKNGELFKGQICDELVCVDTLTRDIVLSTKGNKEPKIEVSEIIKLKAFINNNLLTFINKMKANNGNGLIDPEKFERNFAGKNVILVVDEKSDTHLHIVLMFDGVSTLNIPVPKHNFKPNEFADYVVANPFINTTLLNKPERLTESKEHQKDMNPLLKKMYGITEATFDRIIPDDIFKRDLPNEAKDFLKEQIGNLSLESFVEMFNNFKFKTPDEIEEEKPICDCRREKEIYVNLIIENIEAYVDMKTSKALSLVLPNGCPVVISHNVELDEILVTVNNIHEFKLTPEFHTQEAKQLAETLMKDVDLDIESFESKENDKVDVTINPFEGSMKVGIMEVPVKRQVQDLEEAPKAETKDQKFVEVWGIKQIEDGKFKVTIDGNEFVGTLNECLMKTLKSKTSN